MQVFFDLRGSKPCQALLRGFDGVLQAMLIPLAAVCNWNESYLISSISPQWSSRKL